MGSEPGVDTSDVESVTTLGQEPKSLVLLKLAQANRAVRAFDETLVLLVLEGRDRGDDRGLETDGADVPDVVVHRSAVLLIKERARDLIRVRRWR